jgi:hypothetical protein
MEANPRDALDEARAAFRDENYGSALERYEHFFDHALDEDAHSLYGVRLSYCLSEWAELGTVYPLAMRRLEEKANESLALLTQTREPERFHDFVAICRYLDREPEPIHQFLRFSSSDRDLASLVIRFIWDALVQDRQWSVCETYLAEPKEKYESALMKFDEAMEICRSEPTFGGKELEEKIEGWYVRDVSNILVLKNCGRGEEAAAVEQRAETDMTQRGKASLVVRVRERTVL